MEPERPLLGQRILVVEDEYLIATDLCQWLREAGAEVVGPVSDTGRALRLIDSDLVNAAVIDINLGSGPEFDVARRLTERRIPYVFSTGYDVASLPPEFQTKDRLGKPFNSRELVSAMHALIRCELYDRP